MILTTPAMEAPMRRRLTLPILLLAALVAIALPVLAAVTAVTGTLTAAAPTGTAATLAGNGGNYSIGTGWSGAITLQRSFNGTTWETVAMIPSAPRIGSINDTEPGAQYRFVVADTTTFTGSAAYRLSSW